VDNDELRMRALSHARDFLVKVTVLGITENEGKWNHLRNEAKIVKVKNKDGRSSSEGSTKEEYQRKEKLMNKDVRKVKIKINSSNRCIQNERELNYNT
jgi:uncharacterized protein YdaU (DUF1376 family)